VHVRNSEGHFLPRLKPGASVTTLKRGLSVNETGVAGVHFRTGVHRSPSPVAPVSHELVAAARRAVMPIRSRAPRLAPVPGGAEVRAGLACRLGERRLVRPRLEAEDHAAGVAFSAAAPAACPTLWCRVHGRVSAGRCERRASTTSLASARASLACSTVGTG